MGERSGIGVDGLVREFRSRRSEPVRAVDGISDALAALAAVAGLIAVGALFAVTASVPPNASDSRSSPGVRWRRTAPGVARG